MSDFKPVSLCILGRQPALGLAELERLFGAEHVRRLDNTALLDIDTAEINFQRLGGTIKVAKILNILDYQKWPGLEKYLLDTIPIHLDYLPDGQFTLGLSVYGLNVKTNLIHKSLMKIKKSIKATGRPVRIVPNKDSHLNSAQVLHNKLTTRGAWELLFVKYGSKTILAQTIFVQDIEAYGARDQARPKRDPRVGMLPPKLAQILINLANPPAGSSILDPFCGTGVLLQEALLMGFKVMGSDIDERMVEFSRSNIDWLESKSNPKGEILSLDMADATNYKWLGPVDAVIGELQLGKPFSSKPTLDLIKEQRLIVDKLLNNFLRNIGGQLKKGTVLSIAVPAWLSPGEKFIDLPSLDNLLELGYNRIVLKQVRSDELIYYRPGQFVARRLVLIQQN